MTEGWEREKENGGKIGVQALQLWEKSGVTVSVSHLATDTGPKPALSSTGGMRELLLESTASQNLSRYYHDAE